jgi:hypothetical protein
MSTHHPGQPADLKPLTFDDQVSVVLGGGYPVTGVLKAVVTPHPDGGLRRHNRRSGSGRHASQDRGEKQLMSYLVSGLQRGADYAVPPGRQTR